MALAADKLKNLISIITRLLPQSTTVPPSLAADEVGVELETGKLKVGDGITPWDSLPYIAVSGSNGATGPTGPQGATGPTGSGSSLVDTVNLTNQTSDIAVTAFTGTASTGIYRVAVYLGTQMADVTASTISAQIAWTDAAGVSRTLDSPTCDLSIANGQAVATFTFATNGSGSVTYTVTNGGIYATASYEVVLTAEKLT